MAMAKVLPLTARELGGTGSPIVILHGLLGSSRNWQSAGVALATSGHRVIGLDLRNHGSSPWDDVVVMRRWLRTFAPFCRQKNWIQYI